jgi:hypothetical protein
MVGANCCDVAKIPLTNNEREQRAHEGKQNQIPKEDQNLSLNSEILKSRSSLQVSVGLLL